jgi:hypothetical protein
MVFRSASPRAQPEPAPEPQLTLYGVSPIIELKGPGTLVIERLDKAGERHVLKIDKRQLLRGKFYDLANARKALVAGGIYRAVAGAQRIVFKVDPEAKSGRVPIISRLLRLESAS